MQRAGIDPNNVQMSDILCDFCLTEWTTEVIFIEGHQGSVICTNCLGIAVLEVAGTATIKITPDMKCTLCLGDRSADVPGWGSPVNDRAWVCKSCVELAVGTITKDPATDWTPPGAE